MIFHIVNEQVQMVEALGKRPSQKPIVRSFFANSEPQKASGQTQDSLKIDLFIDLLIDYRLFIDWVRSTSASKQKTWKSSL